MYFFVVFQHCKLSVCMSRGTWAWCALRKLSVWLCYVSMVCVLGAIYHFLPLLATFGHFWPLFSIIWPLFRSLAKHMAASMKHWEVLSNDFWTLKNHTKHSGALFGLYYVSTHRMRFGRRKSLFLHWKCTFLSFFNTVNWAFICLEGLGLDVNCVN